jgi:hypothetical protein
VDRNFTSQASRPFVLRIPGCRNAEISWTGTSQVKRPIPSSFEPPVAEMSKYRGPGLHKSSIPSLPFEPPVAEMPKCPSTYSFGFSRFTKSECKGYLCSLESPVAEMPKCPSAYSFGFSRFTKSGYKGYLCSLESPVAEMPKCPSAAFDQRLTIIPGIYGPRPTSLFRYFVIRGFGRQGPLSFQLAIPEIAKWTNGPELPVIDGSRRIAISRFHDSGF